VWLEDVLEAIIEKGHKTTTYKYALLQSIVDFCTETPKTELINGFFAIPLFYIAKKFLFYYWHFYNYGIWQGSRHDKNPFSISIFNYIAQFLDEMQESELAKQISVDDPNTINIILEKLNSKEILNPKLKTLIYKIRSKCIKQPIRHLPNVLGEKYWLFTLIDDRISPRNAFDYILNNLTNISEIDISSGFDLEEKDPAYLMLSQAVYQEIRDKEKILKTYIQNAWMQDCMKFSNDDLTPEDVYRAFSSIFK